jgi:hypothetical protein
MFGLRFAIDCAQRTKNGQPAHSTTGVANASSSQVRCADGQRQRPPEAAPEIDQLRVLRVVERRQHRLERHAADRTGARRVAHDLGVHRARVARAGRRRGRGRRYRGRRRPRRVALGRGDELVAAARRAEAIVDAVVRRAMRRVGRHAHAADRVDDPRVGLLRRVQACRLVVGARALAIVAVPVGAVRSMVSVRTAMSMSMRMVVSARMVVSIATLGRRVARRRGAATGRSVGHVGPPAIGCRESAPWTRVQSQACAVRAGPT